MRVRHFGNTANNAFYNVLLLEQFAGIGSHLPIRMFGVTHAISAPAWEIVDFDVPSAEWVVQPDWSRFGDAVAVNAEYSDIAGLPATAADDPPARGSLPSRAMTAVGRAMAPLRGKAWAQPVFDVRDRQILAARTLLPDPPDDEIHLMYGADSLPSLIIPERSTRTVCFEHGTIRWIADGTRDTMSHRRAYREQVQRARHLWVTNLDPRTLEVAEDVMPGRWSALPHPFVPDPRVPFAESAETRQKLLADTASEFMVLLPSSQNWSTHHDKGSIAALRAFVELRRRGIAVGLVAVEWGLQVAEAKAFLDAAGVTANVLWVPPLARFALQRVMANVDVVWDQFGLEVFGALALRTVEQGTPLVSRGLAAEGNALIGGPVPWRQAATTEDIVRESGDVFEAMTRTSRDAVISSTRDGYRRWLWTRHSPAITAELQRGVYSRILDGTLETGGEPTDRWSALIDTLGTPERR